MEKYFNDAIIGNSKVKAGITNKGELIRLFYPNIDFRQFIDEFKVGVTVNDSNIIKLEDDINNLYNQFYSEGTNVLNTEIQNTYFNLHIMQTDCAPIEINNVLIRKYKFINRNTIPLKVKLIISSKLLSNTNNEVSAKVIDNGIIQYTHDNTLAIFSDQNILSYKVHNPNLIVEKIKEYDKDYIGMSNNSAIIYEIKELQPNEMIEIPIFIYLNDNDEKYRIIDFEKDIDNILKKDLKSEISKTKKYWRNYLKEHSNFKFGEDEYEKKIERIYNRTILLFPLLENIETGGIAAAMEVDENKTKCGRYAYSWPRDAVFITKAFDELNMNKETEKFYNSFCKNTQSRNGMWEQRFFTDGRLAPAWGYQIDETASVVFGVYNHYLATNDFKFLKDNFRMIERATKYLQKYTEKIIKGERVFPESYDLWEMHEGINLYSLSSIYAAFNSMIKINDKMEYEYTNNRLRQNEIREQKELLEELIIKLKEYIVQNFYDENNKNYRRNLEDYKLDLSILGAIYPFEVFFPNERKVLNTIERINLTLRTYTGGYLRFEDDHYTQDRPWVITTLWMALYYIKAGMKEKAEECFEFVVKTQNQHGLLAEQINNYLMEPAWVIGLGWSHAMFIIVLNELRK